MTALDLIKQAEAEGVTMALIGDRVKLCAARKPSADLLEGLRSHKPEIVQLLQKAEMEQHLANKFGAERVRPWSN